MRGVEAVVGNGVAEYAELAAFEGGQCSLLKEIIPLSEKFGVSRVNGCVIAFASKCTLLKVPLRFKIAVRKNGVLWQGTIILLRLKKPPSGKEIALSTDRTTGVGQSIDC